MRIRPQELEAKLKLELLPIYLVSGDEPLQLREAADAIRTRARELGYASREVLEADTRFDWSQLTQAANSLSLFAEQRIIDLRIPSGKPGTEGARALVEYAARPPEDTLLMVTLPKLERGQSSSKWFKALDSAGAVTQVWPVEGVRLQAWIEQRLRSAGLIPGPGVAQMLAERIEGNLLAAVQEIEKLLLIRGPGQITGEHLIESVADSARYDVFGLVDSALEGRTARCLRMLEGLRAEGTAALIILWALTREIRLLCSLSRQVSAGSSPQQVVAGRREIWDKRKPLVSQGLQRLRPERLRRMLKLCGQTDRAIKGRDPNDPWLLLQDLVASLSGAPPLV